MEAIKIVPLINLLGFMALGVLPTLIMHLSHFFANRNFEVLIDPHANQITFKEKEEFQYAYEDLTVTRHLPLYHKKKLDGNHRMLTPWSNYSFIRVRTNDNKEFNISSTLLNYEDFPIEPSQTNYSLWPMMKKAYIDHEEGDSLGQ
ncbi:hypothetical protein GCM10011506_09160 [Marivirga lumbricoides]|nr:hypothetical protein GCM10011506_09160 [Marivirga lumbricoides]